MQELNSKLEIQCRTVRREFSKDPPDSISFYQVSRFVRLSSTDPIAGLTPAYSPESNGMAEAFVKTFKRDYAWPNDLSSARKVTEQLPKWFDDYNEMAPHKGLKMLSLRQFRQKYELQNLTG